MLSSSTVHAYWHINSIWKAKETRTFYNLYTDYKNIFHRPAIFPVFAIDTFIYVHTAP